MSFDYPQAFMTRRFAQFFDSDETLSTALQYASRVRLSHEKRPSISSKALSSAEARKFQRLFYVGEKTPGWDETGVLNEARALIFEQLGRAGVFIPEISTPTAYLNDFGRIETHASVKDTYSGKDLSKVRASGDPKFKTRQFLLSFANDRGCAVIHSALEFNRAWRTGSEAKVRRERAGLPIRGLKEEKFQEIMPRLIREVQANTTWQTTEVIGGFSHGLSENPSWQFYTDQMLVETNRAYFSRNGFSENQRRELILRRDAATVEAAKVSLEISAAHAATKRTWDRALALAVLGQAIRLYSTVTK